MSVVDELVKNNREYAARFDKSDLSPPPGKRIAIVTCMDSRINVYALLGLNEGEAHVLRNAGGVVTEDVIRSLLISQRQLGTNEIMLIHHLDCSMRRIRDDDFREAILHEMGIRPPFAMEAFDDPAADVRQSLARLTVSPFVASSAARGFVLDDKTGRLEEVW